MCIDNNLIDNKWQEAKVRNNIYVDEWRLHTLFGTFVIQRLPKEATGLFHCSKYFMHIEYCEGMPSSTICYDSDIFYSISGYSTLDHCKHACLEIYNEKLNKLKETIRMRLFLSE